MLPGYVKMSCTGQCGPFCPFFHICATSCNRERYSHPIMIRSVQPQNNEIWVPSRLNKVILISGTRTILCLQELNQMQNASVSNTTFEGKIWQTSLGWRLKKCCDSWFLTLMKQPTPNSVVIVRNGFVVAPIGVTLREGEGRGERTVDATATASERASSSSFRVEIPSLSLFL